MAIHGKEIALDSQLEGFSTTKLVLRTGDYWVLNAFVRESTDTLPFLIQVHPLLFYVSIRIYTPRYLYLLRLGQNIHIWRALKMQPSSS